MRARASLGAVLAATSLAGCGVLQAGESNDLAGVVNVMDMHIRAEGAPCSGARPFIYLHEGAAVVVRDAGGTVVAEGELGPGEAVGAHEPLEHLDRAPSFCRLVFEVEGVPPADTYEVQFGGGHTVAFEAAELEADDWIVEVTLP